MEDALFDLKIGQSAEIEEKGLNTYSICWHVTRVPNGWIFIEDNPNSSRTPIHLFVPLTTYSNPTI